jgi:diguanylate cyclase (GGDEF)-like protein/PAS domain S-box-containing protein
MSGGPQDDRPIGDQIASGLLGRDRFQHAFFAAVVGMAIVTIDGNFLQVNPALCDLVGYDEDDLLRLTHPSITHADDVQQETEQTQRLLAGEIDSFRIEKRYVHREGHEIWSELSVSLVRNEAGRPRYLIAQMVDITDRKLFEQQLLHQAFHDRLTGLPNRALFMDRLDHALARRPREDETIAVLFLDLDNFKVINDSLGHRAGDQLLLTMAERLQTCVREGDTVARLGGDEFTVLLEHITDLTDAILVAQRIAEQSLTLYTIGDREVSVTASIGIAIPGEEGETADDLIRNADIAMYEAKRRGKARYEVFAAPMNVRAHERLELEIELRRAVERGEFVLHYQPVVDLRTGRIVEVEALIRWRHPLRGLLPPADFISIAEETGAMIDIGGWVLRRACRRLQQWQQEFPASAGQQPLTMSVNLSTRQFLQPALVDTVREVLDETGIEPRTLKLEVSERVIMEDAVAAIATLRDLRALGIKLAIDDFGTGYSSLAYLKQFAVNILKIDRMFVDGISHDIEDTSIVEAVLAIGKSLGIRTVAEGVETPAQLAFLTARGCNSGQGHLFSPPLPPDEFTTLLRNHTTYRMPPPGGGQMLSLIGG